MPDFDVEGNFGSVRYASAYGYLAQPQGPSSAQPQAFGDVGRHASVPRDRGDTARHAGAEGGFVPRLAWVDAPVAAASVGQIELSRVPAGRHV